MGHKERLSGFREEKSAEFKMFERVEEFGGISKIEIPKAQ